MSHVGGVGRPGDVTYTGERSQAADQIRRLSGARGGVTAGRRIERQHQRVGRVEAGIGDARATHAREQQASRREQREATGDLERDQPMPAPPQAGGFGRARPLFENGVHVGAG